MKKLWQGKKFTPLSVIILLELIITAVVLLTLFIPEKSYNIQRGETIKLLYGHYYVTCEYQVDNSTDDVNFVFIQNRNGSVKGIKQVDNYLDSAGNSFSTEFWVDGLAKDVTVSVRQFGEKEESKLVQIDSVTIKG